VTSEASTTLLEPKIFYLFGRSKAHVFPAPFPSPALLNAARLKDLLEPYKVLI
jgi:hypothetical protein